MTKEGKKRLHFVYAVPHASKTRMLTLNKTPLYRRHWKYFIKWPKPISAPFSITYQILQRMSKCFEIYLYDANEKVEIDLGSDDIFIGHVWPDMKTKKTGNNHWTFYDPEQVTNRTVLKYPGDERVFIMTPFNHSTEQLGWASPLLKKANVYIGICGDYWTENILKSNFSFLKDSMVHLNMGIDLESYPRIKYLFNPRGKRKFLYIGRVSKEKNIEMLESIASNIDGFEGGYIGDGTIRGWNQIASRAALTPAYMKKLSREYDFFINVSTFDAQVTTVLEAMAWGFVVACTPQSGYTEKGIFTLSTDCLQTNTKIIEVLNNMEETELLKIADDYQMVLKQKFSWKRFTRDLTGILMKSKCRI